MANAMRLALPSVWLALLFAMLCIPSGAHAHRLDEYLQATLVSLEAGEVRLQINLTPGVAVAEQVLAVIDRDHNGVISVNEAAVYAEMVKRDLIVRLDRRKVSLTLTASSFPEVSELRNGWGFIQLEFTVTSASMSAGSHRLSLKNRHLPAVGVYLFNAAQPRAGEIEITRQKRNESQSLGEIEFAIHR
jgi:hypothetical protein